MKDIEAILNILAPKARELRTFAMLYGYTDQRNSVRYRAQTEAIDEIRALIAGHEFDLAKLSSCDGETSLPDWLDWTALVVQALGDHAITIFGTRAAGEAAYEAFCREHKQELERDIRCHLLRVDANELSPELVQSAETRFVKAFICEVGGHYGTVSLYETADRAKAQIAYFEEDNAYYYAQEDAYCTWLDVALPRIKR